VRRAAKRFINHIKTGRGLSRETVESYRDDLKKFIEFVETRKGKGLLPGDVTPEVIQEFLDFLASTGYRRRNGASSRAKRLVTIRTFFRYLHREGLLGRDPADGIKGPKVTYAEPHYLQPSEYCALLRGAMAHPNRFMVWRDQALLATFLGTGARVGELIRLDLQDLDIRAKRIRLLRKGGDVQTLPLSDGIVSFLRAYLRQRRRRAHCRAVFVSIRAGASRSNRSETWSSGVPRERGCRQRESARTRCATHLPRPSWRTERTCRPFACS